ncbi:hypothetical protein MSS93_09265 [Deinococcus radiodurans]|nr:hypothetical protein MSS93_09265 [Deinococcus radiodurans]
MKMLLTGLTLALAASAAAQTSLPADTVRIHYQRPDGAYAGWGLHAWEDVAAAVDWNKPLAQTGKDDWGAYWDVKLRPGAQKLGFLVHQGDAKDPGADLWYDLARGRELFLKSGSANVAYVKTGPFDVDATKQTTGSLPRRKRPFLPGPCASTISAPTPPTRAGGCTPGKTPPRRWPGTSHWRRAASRAAGCTGTYR